MGCIYKITNQITKKQYVGKTQNFNQRIKFYKTLNCKAQPKVYNSLLEYGVDNHTFEIIENCNNDIINEREVYWIDTFDTFNNGLNSCRVSVGGNGGWNINNNQSTPKTKWAPSTPEQKELWDAMSSFIFARLRYIILGNRWNLNFEQWHLQKEKVAVLKEAQTQLHQQYERLMKASSQTTKIEFQML